MLKPFDLSPTVVGYNEEYKVMVDQMGLPLDHGTLACLIILSLRHMQRSKLEMEGIARRLVEKRCPGMLNQLNWEVFTDGFDDEDGMKELIALRERGGFEVAEDDA